MRVDSKPMVAAVSLTLMALSGAVSAQTPAEKPEAKVDATDPKAAKKGDAQAVDTFDVTGIRASLEKSIAVKKDAATNVEVVNAEDVGKMPDGGRYFAAAGSLSASIGYRVNDKISVHLDANNLNNPVRYTYHIDKNAPAAFYENGRQYFATLRVKF